MARWRDSLWQRHRASVWLRDIGHGRWWMWGCRCGSLGYGRDWSVIVAAAHSHVRRKSL